MKKSFKRRNWNKKRFKNKWRKPRGRHNKLRLKKKGRGRAVSIGYGSNKKTRGLVKGLKKKIVHNLKDLQTINKKEGIMIGKTVSLKKRIAILEKCKELKLTVLNIKNVDDDLNKLMEKFASRKERRVKTLKEKKEKEKEKEEAAKKKEEKSEEKEVKTEEEVKKEQQKIETDLLKKEKPVIKQAKEVQAKDWSIARSKIISGDKK